MSSITKNKRKVISLNTKIQILDLLATGEGVTSVGRHFGLNEATVRTIRKNEATIRKSVCCGTKLSAKSSSYTRDIVKEKMEKALVVWIEDNSQNRIPIDGISIKQTALRIYRQIQEKEPTTSSQLQKKHEFSASTGWMTGFLKRHALRVLKTKGKTTSDDESTAQGFPEKFAKIIEDGGYTPDQVWNVDETGMFWAKMPNRTYVAKARKTTGGLKAANAKDRITLLFCTNASGDRMLKPVLVNRFQRPRSMRCVNFNKLPVHWMTNKNAWVTSDIFTEWFHKCFVPEVRGYMKEKGLQFKVLLILDNAPGHPILNHPNVQLCFLPANVTSLIQPLKQGIITSFKTFYIKRSFQYVLSKLSNDETLTFMDVWKKFSIVDSITQIGLALSELTPATLNASWRSIWPGCVQTTDPVRHYTVEFPNIITLANAIGGEGFDDMSHADIDELLVDGPLSEDEIIDAVLETTGPGDEKDPLSAHLIRKGLKLASKLSNHFAKHDLNKERAGKFQHELNLLMAPYSALHKGLAKHEHNI